MRGFLPVPPRLTSSFIALGLMVGCSGPKDAPTVPPPDRASVAAPSAPADPATTTRSDSNKMDGATSPTGEQHPGEILHIDKIDDREWSRAAADVPQTIAWVASGDTWIAVTKIEITGTTAPRRMTKFGPDGAMLETTVQGPPPPQRRDR